MANNFVGHKKLLAKETSEKTHKTNKKKGEGIYKKYILYIKCGVKFINNMLNQKWAKTTPVGLKRLLKRPNDRLQVNFSELCVRRTTWRMSNTVREKEKERE